MRETHEHARRRPAPSLGTITRDHHTKKDQLFLLIIGKYKGFSVYRRSCSIWPPVVIAHPQQRHSRTSSVNTLIIPETTHRPHRSSLFFILYYCCILDALFSCLVLAARRVKLRQKSSVAAQAPNREAFQPRPETMVACRASLLLCVRLVREVWWYGGAWCVSLQM